MVDEILYYTPVIYSHLENQHLRKFVPLQLMIRNNGSIMISNVDTQYVRKLAPLQQLVEDHNYHHFRTMSICSLLSL